MTELAKRRRAIMAGRKPGKQANYTIVGEPTISDDVMTPNETGWITTPDVFNPLAETWQITFSVDVYSGLNRAQNYITSSGIMVQSVNGGVKLYLRSTSGSNFDILSGGTAWAISRGKLWIRISYNGSTYTLQTSPDGVTWTSRQTTASNLQIRSGKIAFGAKASNTDTVSAGYDLNDMEIIVGNAVWWKALV